MALDRSADAAADRVGHRDDVAPRRFEDDGEEADTAAQRSIGR